MDSSSSNCKNPPLMFETNDLKRAFANSFSTVFFLILVFLAFKSLIQFIRRGSSTQTELPVQQQQQTCSSSSQAAEAGLLAAIPVLIYEPESMDSSSSECESCSICLDGFEHGDTVRVLPRCKHMFHKDCIDKWLPSRSIFCPVCRDRTIGAEEGENLDQNDEGGRTNNCNTNGGSSSSAAPPPVIIINVVSPTISTNPL